MMAAPSAVSASRFLLSPLGWGLGRRKTAQGEKAPGGTKFAFISHVLPPSWSGQAVMIGRILSGVDANAYCLISCKNYTSDSNGRFIPNLPAKYYRLPARPRPIIKIGTIDVRFASFLLITLIRARSIARVVLQEGCSAIVAATGEPFDLPAGYLASRLVNIPYYPYLFDDYVYQWRGSPFSSFAVSLGSTIFANAKDVIVPNEFLARDMYTRYRVHASIVRNPSGNDLGIEKPTELVRKGGEVQIVYTGAIYYVNADVLRKVVEALKLLEGTKVKLHLYTAQSEEYLRSEGIFGEQVEIHAHVSPDEIARLNLHADILLLPFSFESKARDIVRTSAPGKLSDYLTSGRPVLAVAPPDSFVSWYVRQHECGLLVDRDDPVELAGAINRLIDDKQLVSSLVAKARARALVDFTTLKARTDFLRVLSQE